MLLKFPFTTFFFSASYVAQQMPPPPTPCPILSSPSLNSPSTSSTRTSSSPSLPVLLSVSLSLSRDTLGLFGKGRSRCCSGYLSFLLPVHYPLGTVETRLGSRHNSKATCCPSDIYYMDHKPEKRDLKELEISLNKI